jgi:hypothetical protein
LENPTELTDDDLFFIPLQQLVRISQPPNCEPIQNLLLGEARRQLWSKTTRIISKLTPWIGSSTSVTPKYKAFEFNELGNGQYILHSVCSRTSHLRNEFFVRVG